MLKKIRRYIEQWHMIEDRDKIIAGVSGGADSVCLLLVLAGLRKELSFEIVVVHVNHGLRGEAADADEQYVKALCEKNHIPCIVYHEDVELIAKKRKQSLEEAGRIVRREAFDKTMRQCGGTKIALAHHKNDNAETFFLNLARGAGIKGLGGMLPVNGNMIRPLLSVERAEIEQYLREEGVAFCIDESNESDDYTRNRIRNHIIPYLEEKINARTIAHINETMEQLREIQMFVDDQTELFQEKCIRREEEGFLILKEQFQMIPEVIRPFVLKQGLKETGGREKNLQSVHLKVLRELFEKQPGRKADLPYDVEAVRVYDGVLLRRKKNVLPEGKKEQILELRMAKKGVCEWKNRKIRYRIFEKSDVPEKHAEKVYTKWFDYDIIKDTVSVRTREQGDYITIHQDGRTQKLKSYFVNEKIPQERRDEIPLIVEGSHILWIVGFRVSSAYRITENTKQILEIQIDEGENYVRED